MQTLKEYLEHCEPVGVITENGLLTPYKLREQTLLGKSSGIGPQTQTTYRDCLKRIPGEPLNPEDFVKTSQNRIHHLGITTNFLEAMSLLSPREKYLGSRLAAEAMAEFKGEPNPFGKKWEDLEEREREAILIRIPSKKVDFAWQTLHGIELACISDCIGLIQRTDWADRETPTLYEVRFDLGSELGIDIYLKRPSV